METQFRKLSQMAAPGEQYWFNGEDFIPVEDIITQTEIKKYKVTELRLSELVDLEKTYPGRYYVMAGQLGMFYIIRKIPQTKREKAASGSGVFTRNRPFKLSDFIDSYVAPNSYKKPCKHFVMRNGYTIIGISALMKHYPHITAKQVQDLYNKFGYGKLNAYEKRILRPAAIDLTSKAKKLIKRYNIQLDPTTDMFLVEGESWTDSDLADRLGVTRDIANRIIDIVGGV